MMPVMFKGHLYKFVAPAKAGVQLLKESVQCTDKTALYLKPLDTGLHPQGVRRGCKGLKPQQYTQRRYDGLMGYLV
jgi:hypothetical protein